MGYMHSKSIGHLSLTPCDILFTRPGGSEVKICDFSLAKRIVGVVKLEYGQPEYVAPEIVNGEGATFASDMWSCGIITYLLLSGVSPFRGQNDRETLQRIQMEILTSTSSCGRIFPARPSTSLPTCWSTSQ